MVVLPESCTPCVGMDLRDAVTLHQLSLQAEGRSPATQRLYLIYEKKFVEYLDSHRIPPTLDGLNTVNARAALEWFRAQPHAGSRGGQVTARYFVGTLKTWASFLTLEGIYDQSPLAHLKRPRVGKVLRQPLSTQELQALWSASRLTRYPVRDEALLLLLLDTGMRIGEAVTLTLDKLRLDQRHVIVGLEGKGRRERVAPIGDPTKRDGGRTMRALRQYLRERPQSATDNVFVDHRGFPISAEAGSDIIKRIGALAGVANCHAHRLRHSMATHYLTVNVGDELGLRRIIGHCSDEVTGDYVHFAQVTIAQRAGRSSLVEALAAPKDAPRARATEPIAKAWGAASLEPPVSPPARPRTPISELLTGLDADERRALLKALLAASAA